MLERGAHVDSKDNYGWTALSWAAKKGHESIAKLLLSHWEIEVNSRDIYGRTALLWAAENGHAGIAEKLLESNADVCLKDNYNRTPLSCV